VVHIQKSGIKYHYYMIPGSMQASISKAASTSTPPYDISPNTIQPILPARTPCHPTIIYLQRMTAKSTRKNQAMPKSYKIISKSSVAHNIAQIKNVTSKQRNLGYPQHHAAEGIAIAISALARSSPSNFNYLLGRTAQQLSLREGSCSNIGRFVVVEEGKS